MKSNKWTKEETIMEPEDEKSVKIACVGDSITYGTMVGKRKINCYPAQLQRFLGRGYKVENFGVNRHAMLKTSDKPYWNHKNYILSKEFMPDIVLLMLGTNDSKYHNWTTMEAFMNDYKEMITNYQSLQSNPIIYILTPAKAFIVKHRKKALYNMNINRIDEIAAAVKKLAADEGLPVIDINSATASHQEFFKLDGLHPNAGGAKLIAETIYNTL